MVKSTIDSIFSVLPYGGKLWRSENLANLANDQKFANFSPSKFLHIYSKNSHVIIKHNDVNFELF